MTQHTEQSEWEELMTLVERYAAYRVNADRWGNKHGDVDGSENCWRQIRAALLAADTRTQHKPSVQQLMDLARKFRSAPGDLYDAAYNDLQSAAYALLAEDKAGGEKIK